MARDMRDWIAQLEEAHELHTVKRPVDPRTEPVRPDPPAQRRAGPPGGFPLLSASGRADTTPAGRVVSVKFLGYLRRVAGHREIRVAVDADATVDDLLQTLARAHGDEFSQAVFRAPGEVHTHLRAFLDEHDAELDDRVARAGGAATSVAVLVVPGFEGGSR